MSRNLKPEDLKGLLAALKNQLERLLPGDAIPPRGWPTGA